MGVDETRPAVISVNFVAASVAVNDFLARLNDYRSDYLCVGTIVGGSRYPAECAGAKLTSLCGYRGGRLLSHHD